MKNNTRVRLSYTATDPNTNDTVMDLDLSFENVDYVKLKDNLNTWLKATGYELEVVHPKGVAKSAAIGEAHN